MDRYRVKFLPFLIVLLLNFYSGYTQTIVKNISISQVKPLFKEEFLLKSIPLKKNSIFTYEKLDSSLKVIKFIFQQECYYFVEVTIDSLSFSSDSSSTSVYLNVNPKNKYVIEELVFTGNIFLSRDRILEIFQTKVGNCLNRQLIESDIEQLLKIYESNGFPWASVKINKIELIDSNIISVEILIDEQYRAKIEKIVIEGNKETAEKVIVRETRIKPGEFYNHERVKKIPMHLNKMLLFKNVEEPELVVSDTKYQEIGNSILSSTILVKVQEGNFNNFNGIIGYLPGSSNEKGYFIGMIDVTMRNLFGTARKLNLRWLRDDRYSQEIGIRYTEPWLLNYPINLKNYFFQRQQDTTFIRRYFELKSEFMLSDNLSLSVVGSQENIIPSRDVIMTSVSNSSINSLGTELIYDTRDYIYNPTSGAYYRTDYFYGKKRITNFNQKLTVQRFGFDLEFYRKTFLRQVAYISFHGRDIRSSNIELSDLYRFGGTNTLRGYRENQFLGSRIYWINIENRYIVGRRSFLYVFFDIGYYYRKFLDPDEVIQAIKYGYGIGFRVETVVGVVGINFALGKGDNLEQGKIHFGLINEF